MSASLPEQLRAENAAWARAGWRRELTLPAGIDFTSNDYLALAREADLSEALSAAVAAASAAVMTEATELCSAVDALRLIGDCPTERI